VALDGSLEYDVVWQAVPGRGLNSQYMSHIQFVEGMLLPLVPHKVPFIELLFGGTALVRRHTPLVELHPHKARLLFILREKDGAVVVRARALTIVVLERLADELVYRPVELLK
jgi:hypothetical protein